MATIDTILFEDFADALNRELSAIGATVRVRREGPGACGTMVLQAADGRSLGSLPDHADAPTIKAFEAIMSARDTVHRYT